MDLRKHERRYHHTDATRKDSPNPAFDPCIAVWWFARPKHRRQRGGEQIVQWRFCYVVDGIEKLQTGEGLYFDSEYEAVTFAQKKVMDLWLASLPKLPKDFGDGWMSNNAADLCKIAVMFGGFDREELVRRIVKRIGERRLKGEKVNVTTVEAVMSEMYDEEHTDECDCETCTTRRQRKD